MQHRQEKGTSTMKIESIEIPSCFESEFRCPYCAFQLCPEPQEMPFCSHITFLHIRDCCDSNGFAVVKHSFARKYMQKIMESKYVEDYESDDLITTLNVLLEKEDPLELVFKDDRKFVSSD